MITNICYPLSGVVMPVSFLEGETIAQVLAKKSIVLSSDEVVKDDRGNIVDLEDTARTIEYNIVSNVKNGNQ